MELFTNFFRFENYWNPLVISPIGPLLRFIWSHFDQTHCKRTYFKKCWNRECRKTILHRHFSWNYRDKSSGIAKPKDKSKQSELFYNYRSCKRINPLKLNHQRYFTVQIESLYKYHERTNQNLCYWSLSQTSYWIIN